MLINILGFIWVASMLGNIEPVSRILKLDNPSASRASAAMTLSVSPQISRYPLWVKAILFDSVSSTYWFSSSRAAGVMNGAVSDQASLLVERPMPSQTDDKTQDLLSVEQPRRLQTWLTHIGSLIWWPGFGEAPTSNPPLTAARLTWPSAAQTPILDLREPHPVVASEAAVLSDHNDRIHRESAEPNSDVILKVVQPTDQDIGRSGEMFSHLGDRAHLAQCLGWVPPESIESLKTQGKTAYQIWVKGTWVGEVANLEVAHAIAQQLKAHLQADDLKSEEIQLTRVDGWPGVKVGSQVLFVANPEITADLSLEETWMVIGWANNLRIALGGSPLDMGSMQMLLYEFDTTGDRFAGVASWYGPYFHGRQTANGEIFDQYALTAAHPSLPLGTYLKVTNELNARTVIVRVNDRGPYIGDRSLDLSRAAAQCLGSEQLGIIPYQAEVLQIAQLDASLSAAGDPALEVN